MQMIHFFVILAAAGLVWYVVATIRIMDYVQKKGVKINWLLIRLLLFSYVGQYQKLTKADTGKTGVWFYHFIFAINAALVFAILAVLAKKGVL